MTVRTQRKGNIRVVLAAATALAIPALAVVAALPATAQMTHAVHGGPSGWHGRADHVEGRIAFYKAELKITDSQAKAWDGVAQAMRRSAEADRALRDELRSRGYTPMNAVERLALRDKVSAVRTENAKAFTAAFTALYGQLSDDQKKAADQMLSPRRHRRA